MINLGGSESNLVFSDFMRKNILLDKKFNYNYSLAYLYSSNDMPGYTAFVYKFIEKLKVMDPVKRKEKRIEKFCAMGVFNGK